MKLVKCDRCGKVAPPSSDFTDLLLDEDVSFEICEACRKAFNKFMKNERVEAQA
jgi:hypothetical protein